MGNPVYAVPQHMVQQNSGPGNWGGYVNPQFQGGAQQQYAQQVSTNATVGQQAQFDSAQQKIGGQQETDAAKVAAETKLKTTSTSFVPKGKIVKTEEYFPTLGSEEPKKGGKGKAAPAKPVQQVETTPSAPADPTFGNPKEFFALVPQNPNFAPDPVHNPLLPTEQQMTFMYIHYPEHTKDFMNL